LYTIKLKIPGCGGVASIPKGRALCCKVEGTNTVGCGGASSTGSIRFLGGLPRGLPLFVGTGIGKAGDAVSRAASFVSLNLIV